MKKIYLSLIVILFAFPVIAEEANIDDLKFPSSDWNLNLLDGASAGGSMLADIEYFEVAPPPSNSSEETKKELEYLIEIAKTERTKDNVARIHYENNGGKAHEFFLKEGLIDAANYKTVELLKMIDVDHMYFILERKKHFSRPRPSHLAAELGMDLSLVISNPGHPAYPSGHASQTYMVALVLADFDPENAEIYKQFAVDVAHRREIAGVHYVSDSVSGRQLAVDVLAKLRTIPAFEKKFQAAKLSYVKPSLKTDNNAE